MGPYKRLPLWIGVAMGVLATKEYSTFPRASEFESYHQIQFSVIFRTPFFYYCLIHLQIAQSAGAVEYTDCTSAEG